MLTSIGEPSARLCNDAAAIDPRVIDLAIDCTGHAGLLEHGVELLKNGIDVLSISTGALSEPGAAGRLEDAARTGGVRLRFATGAIGGIDALSSACIGGLQQVVYTGRKPPAGWKGSVAEETIDLAGIREPTVHFEGTAREAATRYPKNANVAAVVAFASLGLDATKVALIADPALDRNCHEISATGEFGSLRIELQGASLPGNPRSSALAAMSVVRAIESMLLDDAGMPMGLIGATQSIVVR